MPTKRKPRPPIATRAYEDSLTGELRKHPGPGAEDAGRFIARIRTRKGAPFVQVEVDREDLGWELPRRWRVDPETLDRYRRQAATKIKRLKGVVRKSRRERKTFPSYKQAAENFYNHNDLYFENIGDAAWVLRDWIKAQYNEKGTRLVKTKIGRDIANARKNDKVIKLVLLWLFRQARRKRWEDIDWQQVDDMLESLHVGWREPEPAAAGQVIPEVAIYWWPPGSGREERSLQDQFAWVRKAELNELDKLIVELKTAYRRTRKCLPPESRKAILSRIRIMSRWLDDPELAEKSIACNVETDHSIGQQRCFFPRIEEEIARVRIACEKAYNPDWPEGSIDE